MRRLSAILFLATLILQTLCAVPTAACLEASLSFLPGCGMDSADNTDKGKAKGKGNGPRPKGKGKGKGNGENVRVKYARRLTNSVSDRLRYGTEVEGSIEASLSKDKDRDTRKLRKVVMSDGEIEAVNAWRSALDDRCILGPTTPSSPVQDEIIDSEKDNNDKTVEDANVKALRDQNTSLMAQMAIQGQILQNLTMSLGVPRQVLGAQLNMHTPEMPKPPVPTFPPVPPDSVAEVGVQHLPAPNPTPPSATPVAPSAAPVPSTPSHMATASELASVGVGVPSPQTPDLRGVGHGGGSPSKFQDSPIDLRKEFSATGAARFDFDPDGALCDGVWRKGVKLCDSLKLDGDHKLHCAAKYCGLLRTAEHALRCSNVVENFDAKNYLVSLKNLLEYASNNASGQDAGKAVDIVQCNAVVDKFGADSRVVTLKRNFEAVYMYFATSNIAKPELKKCKQIVKAVVDGIFAKVSDLRNVGFMVDLLV